MYSNLYSICTIVRLLCESLTEYFFNTKCHKVFQEKDNGMSGLPRMVENSPIDETLFIQGEGKKLASAVRNYIVNILLGWITC